MNEKLPSRKALRLKDYDYSKAGYYFITICTSNHKNTLAGIRRGDLHGRPKVSLSELGEICTSVLNKIEDMYGISVIKHVIMPNHIHFIISIDDTSERTTARVAPTIGSVLGSYKSIVSKLWLSNCKERDIHMGQLWQRGYYDHVIRDEADYLRIWQYIDENPDKWQDDCYYTP